MNTKHEVLKLIVDLSEENEQMTKSIVGLSIVDGAKKALNQKPDIKVLKSMAESILYIVKCIEDLEAELFEMKNKNLGIYTHKESDIQGVERLIRKYYESLTKVIQEI